MARAEIHRLRPSSPWGSGAALPVDRPGCGGPQLSAARPR